MEASGKVWLVGAGPGDRGLFTLKGKEVLEKAQVVVYDALVSREILSLIPDSAEAFYAGKRAHHNVMKQEEINELLLKKAQEGKRVVRLKGGDPFVFGRGGEELELLVQNKIPFEIVPGITSSVAVPAYAGIPVTHREYTSSFHIITGHAKEGSPLLIDFESLVKLDGTLVFLMGISAMEEICKGLIDAGMTKDTPAAVIQKGTTSKQMSVNATIESLVEESDKAQIKTPAIIIIGKVCELGKEFAWAMLRPLGGKEVVITRPKEANQEMAIKLRSLGAQVIEMPMIKTVPLDITKKEKEQLKQISYGNHEKWIVFTSAQGVRYFFEQLKELEWDLRRLLGCAVVKFAVIGKGTKKALEKHGIFADLMPEVYSAVELGKALVRNVSEKGEVFIFRAEKGSRQLTDILREAEIMYVDIPIYKTVHRAAPIMSTSLKKAFATEEIDYVTFTSGSAVVGFVEEMRGIDFTKVVAICIGEQTALTARKYGMQVKVSKEASIKSMIELITELSI